MNYRRISGWIVVGFIVGMGGAAAGDLYVAAERERERVLVALYDDEANFAGMYQKYRDVLKKYRDYTAQGVTTIGLDASLAEIKEDLIVGAYVAAEKKIVELDAALEAALAQKNQQPAPPSPTTAKKTTATPPPPTPPPPSPVSAECGASYYTQGVIGYTAYVIEADVGSGCVKVVTDTAYGGSNCADNCPVFSLSHYVSSNGGFGGMNGTYFCPADYAACAGSDGSFFWKVYNSNVKFIHNANNGLAHLDPFVAIGANNQVYYYQYYREEVSGVCQPGSFCSVSAFEAAHGALQAGLGCGPALVANGNNVLDEGKLDDKQKTTKSNRGAIGIRGNTLFLIIVAHATVIDLAAVLDNMDIDHAFNVDGGGSAAMYWQGAYKRGPGRSIPNVIVLVNK